MRRAIFGTAVLLVGALITVVALLGSVVVADLLAEPAFAHHPGDIPVHLAGALAHRQMMPSSR